jgi:hypothetical protein
MSTGTPANEVGLDGPHTPAPLPIGVNPVFSDCVIKRNTGTLYYTSRAAMVSCSPVFRGLVECCSPHPSSAEVGELQSSGFTEQGNTGIKC